MKDKSNFWYYVLRNFAGYKSHILLQNSEILGMYDGVGIF
jgi:hypothetical protein